MLTLDQITRRASEDGVDSDTVARDYVLTHVVISLARHPNAGSVQFKGGTALRLCHFTDYRYSADIDLNVTGSIAHLKRLLTEALDDARLRIEIPVLELSDEPKPRILFVGPKRRARPRPIDRALRPVRSSIGSMCWGSTAPAGW